MRTLFCLGHGYTASAVARLAITDGWRVVGATRSPDKAAFIKKQGVEPVLWNDASAMRGALDAATALLISTPPGRGAHSDNTPCPALDIVQNAPPKRAAWIGYLSTNGVYGDHGGAWVSETTRPNPTSERGRRRLAAEQAWRQFGEQTGAPTVVLRLPGIYGPGRSALDSVRAGTAKRIVKEAQFFSRAHVDDIAAATVASLNQPTAGDLFNIADDEPTPPQDVITYACDLLGVAPPPFISLEDASLSEMARSFYSDNKRVSNAKMKDVLGVTLGYPTYRDGLRAIHQQEVG